MSKAKDDSPGCMGFIIGGIIVIVIVGGLISVVWGGLKSALGFEEEKTVLTDTSGKEYPSEKDLPYCNYVHDERANKIVSYYNYFYGDKIAKDQVTNDSLDHSEILLNNMKLIITESDGEGHYQLMFDIPYSEENENTFLLQAKKLIHSVYPELSENTIQSEIIDVLKSKDNQNRSITNYKIGYSYTHYSYYAGDDYMKFVFGTQSIEY